MKKFIFVTPEGEVISPNQKTVKNWQVVGIVENVKNEDEGLKKLLRENNWIFDYEFNVAEFKAYEIS